MTAKTGITVDHALAVARIALRFGEVPRVTRHEDGAARETDTTHTVMLGLLAMEFARALGLDPTLAAQYALVHDLAETYAGDTDTSRGLSEAEKAEKEKRESEARQRLSYELAGGPGHIFTTLRHYEAQRSCEARLVRYLDKVLPKLTHFLNNGAALVALGLTAAQVQASHDAQAAALAKQYPELTEVGQLFAEATSLIKAGIATGTVSTADTEVDDAPVVCPGCFAVGLEKHADDCIDQEMEMDRLDREERERNDPTEEDDDA